MQGTRQSLRIQLYRLHCLFADTLRRIHGDTVTGMDSRSLDMLHNARNQNILSIAYRINLDFLSHQIFIHKNRMLLRNLVNDTDKFADILIADGDSHALSAEHVGRSDEHWIAKVIRRLNCLLTGKYRMSCRSWNLTQPENPVK